MCISMCAPVERLSGGDKKEPRWNHVLELLSSMSLLNLILFLTDVVNIIKTNHKPIKYLVFKSNNKIHLIMFL